MYTKVAIQIFDGGNHLSNQACTVSAILEMQERVLQHAGSWLKGSPDPAGWMWFYAKEAVLRSTWTNSVPMTAYWRDSHAA